MTEPHSLLKLLSWLSPAFPTGAFSYSHGLEASIHDGMVSDRDNLQNWLETLLEHGPGWNDAIFLAESWRACACSKTLDDISNLAIAMAGSKERHLETTAQGNAFLTAAKNWNKTACESLPDFCPLPIAVGALAGAEEIELEPTLNAYLHAYISNQIQAALRLMKLGQTNGLSILRSLEIPIISTANRAASATLDVLGSATLIADIASMRHETLQSRIFRS